MKEVDQSSKNHFVLYLRGTGSNGLQHYFSEPSLVSRDEHRQRTLEANITKMTRWVAGT